MVRNAHPAQAALYGMRTEHRALHLGRYLLKRYTATYRGFDQWLGYYSAAMASYWYHGHTDATCAHHFSTDLSNNTQKTIAGAVGVNGSYSTNLFTEYAVKTIQSHFAAEAPAPMYMYLAHEAVHDASGGGIQAPLEEVNRYDNTILNDTDKVCEPLS